jgi:hypothetical protein
MSNIAEDDEEDCVPSILMEEYSGRMSQWLYKCYRGRNLNLEAETIATLTYF